MHYGDPITTLFRHHLWANLQLYEFCQSLTDEQFAATIPGAYGSVRDTLQHIVTSEQSYFSRISTGQPLRRPADAPPLSIDEMIASLKTTGAGLLEWVGKVQAEDTVAVNWKDGTVRDVPKTIILSQIIYHAAEHREQIKAILTEQGIEPPDLQGWEFFDQTAD